MPSIYDLKPAFQNMLRPFVENIEERGITANMVTLFACGFSVLWGLGLYLSGAHAFFLMGLPVVMVVRMALNAIDGMLARDYNQKSDLGFYLNEFGDIVSDIALYLPFMVLAGLYAPLVMVVVVVAVLIEISGILALGLTQERRYDGPFGKSDRAFAFGALAFLAGIFTLPAWLLNLAFLIFAGLGAYTIYQRINRALDHDA